MIRQWPLLRSAAVIALALVAALPSGAGTRPEADEVAALTRQLRDDRPYVRENAARMLGRTGPQARGAAPGLIGALSDPDWHVRAYAVWALGKVGPDAREAVPPLAKALRDGEYRVQQSAAGALAVFGRPAIPALIAALKDENWHVVDSAADALGHMGPEAKEAIPALREALKRVPRGCMSGSSVSFALAEMGESGLHALVETLKDEDEEVRAGAAWTLKCVPAERAVRIPTEDIPKLVEAARQGSAGYASDIAECLSNIGSRAVPELTRTLNDDQMRGWAAAVIGALDEGAKEAVPELLRALNDEAPEVREAAAQALGRTHADVEEVVPALARALEDSDRNVRSEAAWALGFFEEQAKPAMPALIRALGDRNGWVRDNAALALHGLGPESAPVLANVVALVPLSPQEMLARVLRTSIPELQVLFDLSDQRRERAGKLGAALMAPGAAWVLDEFVPALRGLLELPEDSRFEDFRQAAADALASLGEPGLSHLKRLLHSEDPEARRRAVWALCNEGVRREDAEAELLSALSDDDWEVRKGAIGVLSHIGQDAVKALQGAGSGQASALDGAAASWRSVGTSVVPALSNRLKDSNAEVRCAAAWSLGELAARANETVAKLGTQRSEDAIGVRQTVARAWESFATVASPALLSALADENPYVRIDAATALAKCGAEADDFLPALLSEAGGDRGPAYSDAPDAMKEIGPVALPLLLRTLGSADARTREGASTCLGHIGVAAVPGLIQALSDKNAAVHGAAARALAMIGPDAQAALPALSKALEDSHPEVRESAIEALRELTPEAWKDFT